VQSEDQSSQSDQILTLEGERVELHCRMSIGTGETVAWYRQTLSGIPTFIDSLYQGNKTNGRYVLSIDRLKNSYIMSMEDTMFNDAGMYYCAKQTL
ncbi:hypothetical protein chiPu_0023912, partial [Chiloscyllium punctatum]|nr:hypothetical protein [Chiloscyllium punctatum]